MKKIILVAAALLMAYVANAQLSVGEFAYGVKGGFTTSYITNAHSHNKTSFNAGVFIEKRFNRTLGLNVDLLYTRQGFAYRSGAVKSRWAVGYLQLPVMFKIYLWQGLSVDFGPQFGYNTDARFRTREHRDTDRKKLHGIESFDFAIPAGISFAYKSFFMSARYITGLTDVGADVGTVTVADQTVKFFEADDRTQNRVFQLSVGVYLNKLFK